jgi:hypothetical protein
MEVLEFMRQRILTQIEPLSRSADQIASRMQMLADEHKRIVLQLNDLYASLADVEGQQTYLRQMAIQRGQQRGDYIMAHANKIDQDNKAQSSTPSTTSKMPVITI